MTTSLPAVHLPSREAYLGLDPGAEVTDEQDIAYNAHCTQTIREALLRLKVGAVVRPLVKTYYPFDDDESADTCGLDRRDDVVIVDSGAR